MIIIDAHTHLGLEQYIVKPIPAEKRSKPAFQDRQENTLEELLRAMDRNHVDQAVAFPYPLAEVDPDLANGYVLDAAAQFPGRIIPFVLLGNDVETWIAKGARGFKQHLLLEPDRFDLPTSYRAIAERHLPLIAHLETRGTVRGVEAILAMAPDLHIMVAHMGRCVPNTGQCVLENIDALAKYPNVFFETSTVRDPSVFRVAVERLGTERICFGSDYPFNSHIDQDPLARELDIMKSAGLSEPVLERIMGRNILALTGANA